MLDLSIINGEVTAGQRMTSPSVYLDHWALLDFSEDERLGARLTAGLDACEGTLILSWLNLGEYSKITNAIQARKAERLFEKNLPRLFFIDVEPFRVIDREDEILIGRSKEPPHGNVTLLRELMRLKPKSPTAVYPFTTHNLFAYTQDADLACRFDMLAEVVVDRIETLRTEVANDPTFESIVKRLPAGPPIEAGTRYILRELLRTSLINKAMRITRNHAIDLLHAVVPVAYCDFVLLDGHWEAQVAQMRARVAAARISFPIAKVFSRKANGVERFLTELQSIEAQPE